MVHLSTWLMCNVVTIVSWKAGCVLHAKRRSIVLPGDLGDSSGGRFKKGGAKVLRVPVLTVLGHR